MAVSEELKEFCAHNLVAIIIIDMKDHLGETDTEKLLADFTASETYSELFRLETGLWAEGPDYIMDMYLEEKGLPAYGGE